MPANKRVACPHCPANGENQTYEVGRGLNIHIGRKHPEKKGEPIPEEPSRGATVGVGAHSTKNPKQFDSRVEQEAVKEKRDQKSPVSRSGKPLKPTGLVKTSSKPDGATSANWNSSAGKDGSQDKLQCPHCHWSSATDRGLKMHMTRSHPDEKSRSGDPKCKIDTATWEGCKPKSASTSRNDDIQLCHDSKNHSRRGHSSKLCPPSSPVELSKHHDPNKCVLCDFTHSDENIMLDHLDKAHRETRKLMRGTSALVLTDIQEETGLINFVINDIAEQVGKTEWAVEKVGSYYDKTKIINPNEFDYMFCHTKIRCSAHVKAKNHFCTLERLDPYGDYMKKDQSRRELCPKAFKAAFADRIQKGISELDTRGHGYTARDVKLTEVQKLTSPSVEITLTKTVTHNNKPAVKEMSTADLVPSIELSGWPSCSEDCRCDWLPEKDWKEMKKRYHAVAKPHHTEYHTPPNSCSLWRLSFSTTEKALLFGADGKKGGNENKTFRKVVHKLLKNDLETLKRDKKLDTFSSYHIKTLVLHMFNEYPDHISWVKEKLPLRYLQALMQWRKHVETTHLEHFFIPGDNLLEDMKTTKSGRKDQQLLLKFIDQRFEELR